MFLSVRLYVRDNACMEERMKDLSNTRYFKVQTEPELQVEDVLNELVEALLKSYIKNNHLE